MSRTLSTPTSNRKFSVPSTGAYEFVSRAVPHLLNSNLPPDQAEVALIQDAIHAVQSELDDIYRSPQFPWGTLENELKVIGFKDALRAVLSPIRRLPHDVLALIFVDLDDYRFGNLPVVSQVCRFWREVALSTPQIWTVIILNLTQHQHDLRPRGRLSSQMPNPTLRLKLERSCDALLDIEVTAPQTFNTSNSDLQAILECSYRWRKARFYVAGTFLQVIDRIRSRIPSLRYLFISISENRAPDDPSLTANSFDDAPSLRYVGLSDARGLSLSLPWNQLEAYEEFGSGSIITNEEKIRLLTSASALMMNWSRHNVIPMDSLLCRNLESLQLWFRSNAQLTLFSKIQVPNIKEIVVNLVYEDVIPHLLIMLRNTTYPSTLRSLTFDRPSETPGELTSLLEYTPYLEELQIDLPHEEDLRQLILDPEASVAPLVPKLRKLRFHVGRVRGYEHLITQVAQSRCELALSSSEDNRGAVLTSFILKFSSSILLSENLQLLEITTSNSNSEVPENFVRWALDLEMALANHYALAFEEQREKIDEIFSFLLSTPVDVHHVYQTGIHITLLRFTQNDHYTGASIYQSTTIRELRNRALKILKQWESAILLDIPNRCWGLAHMRLLVYVPKHDKLRSNDPLKIAYGTIDTSAPGCVQAKNSSSDYW